MSQDRTEWIESLQEISLLAGSPIKQKNGSWEILDRKEAWKVIGPRIFDEHLDRFHKVAVEVLRERDPRIELDENERLTADLRGKQLKHSPLLRKGLADTLALLGSMPKALKSCSHGKAEIVAVLAVREILNGEDWVLWASLNSYLPTLAEAAPDEFLDAVESALTQSPCPFVQVFAQEKAGIMGQNYLTGLLWALETLAWSPEYLQRVTVILGELAALDPGGNWANRPANSLTEIFLPWYPQTCASIAHEKAEFAPEFAVQALLDGLKELPSGFNHHAIFELIQWLQENPKTNPDDLFRVEWAYLPLLDHHFERSPKILEKRLAENPKFFCELISVVFRSEKEDRKKAEPTELEQKIATNAYRLLHNWQQPPGTTNDPAFDGKAFSKWLAEVKAKTRESGHFRIAMSQIGQVLAHTPPDPDGLWINHAVADALNDKDAGSMRSGFTMKLFNLRGVHGFSAGKEELAIAEGCHKKAEALEENGYQRFATAMRELAKGYERDAEREAQRNPYGE